MSDSTVAASELQYACDLLAIMRAWASVSDSVPDPMRKHPLYPRNTQGEGGYANEGPLWAAIDALLARHGHPPSKGLP